VDNIEKYDELAVTLAKKFFENGFKQDWILGHSSKKFYKKDNFAVWGGYPVFHISTIQKIPPKNPYNKPRRQFKRIGETDSFNGVLSLINNYDARS
jgi:hypothetical protein